MLKHKPLKRERREKDASSSSPLFLSAAAAKAPAADASPAVGEVADIFLSGCSLRGVPPALEY